MTEVSLPFKWTRPDHLLAFGFGAGLAPVAPGTFGTLVAIPLYVGLKALNPSVYLAAIVLGFVLGVYVCSRVNHEIGREDHPGIVWDEVVGFWVAMLGSPLSWPYVLAGFVLFRLFDIWKPWPISWVDFRLRGGLGVMADDFLAGVFVAVILNLLLW